MVREEREAFLRRLEERAQDDAPAGGEGDDEQKKVNQENAGADVVDDAPITPTKKVASPAPAPDEEDVLRCLTNAGVLRIDVVGGLEAVEGVNDGELDLADVMDASSLEMLRTYSPTPRLLRRRDAALSSTRSAPAGGGGVENDEGTSGGGGATGRRPATTTAAGAPESRRLFTFDSPGATDAKDKKDSSSSPKNDDGGAKADGVATVAAAPASSSPPSPPPLTQEEDESSPRPPPVRSGHRTKKEKRSAPVAAFAPSSPSPIAVAHTDPIEAERRRRRRVAEMAELAAVVEDTSKSMEERLLASMRRQSLAMEALEARVDDLGRELSDALRRGGGSVGTGGETTAAAVPSAGRGPAEEEVGGGPHRPRRGGQYGSFFPAEGNGEQRHDASPPQQQQQAPRRPLRSPLFALADAIDSRTRAACTAVHDRLSHTRPYRIVRASYREARRQNVHANLDLWLLLKLIAVVALFGGRASARRSASGYDPEDGFMAMYRTQILMGAALLVYLFQTGVIGFVHRLIRDLPRLLKEDEEGLRRREAGDGGEGDGEGGGAEGEEAAGDGGRPDGDGAGAGGDANPVGRADARPVGRPPAGPGGPNPPGAAAAAVGAQRPPVTVTPPRRTLADGGVRRRRDDEGAGRGLLDDVRYLVAGFLLSLVPTWRPVVDVDEPQPEQQQEEEGGEDQDGAVVDGEGEGPGGAAGGAGGGVGAGAVAGGEDGVARPPGNADNNEGDGDDPVGGDGQ